MKITELKLKSALSIVSNALENKTRTKREDLFDRYMGEPYGDEVKGRSEYRATDVSDVVEAVFAEGMEIFTSDDHLVEFAPVGEEDEKAARQETDIIHHLFREKNNSFVTLSTWFKSGLIEQNAYVRCGWVEKERVQIEEYEDLTFPEFMQVYEKISAQSVDYEVERLEGFANAKALIEGTEIEPIPETDAKTGLPKTIDVRVRCVKTEKVYEIEPIPQNEFFLAPRWANISLDGCPVCGHVGRKSKSELLAMGFSQDSIDQLSKNNDDSAEINRHDTLDNDDDLGDENNKLEICECYVHANVDNNNKDRLLKMWTNGDGSEVLKWKNGDLAIEEVEFVPFVSWTPYIVPHRHVGRSVAELASTIQSLKTVLWRQTLDNIYTTNYARPEVAEAYSNENTMNDLQSPQAGSPVRVNQPGGIIYHTPPQIIGNTLPLMDRADQELEKHAGASRYAQGLDHNSLSKSQIGSEGVGRIMDAAMRRMQVIIRTFAETGLRELFLKMHADMRKGSARQLALKIRGEWINSSPLAWRDRTDMTVRIGTGKGDREKRIAALQWVLAQQQSKMASGAINVSLQNVYETEKRLVRAMGLQSIEPYITDPSTIPPPEPQIPQPDPAIEAQIAIAQAEGLKAQAAMVKAQTDQAEAQARIEFKKEELRLEREIAEFKAQEATANLEIKKAELELKQAKTINEIENEADDRNARLLSEALQ